MLMWCGIGDTFICLVCYEMGNGFRRESGNQNSFLNCFDICLGIDSLFWFEMGEEGGGIENCFYWSEIGLGQHAPPNL